MEWHIYFLTIRVYVTEKHIYSNPTIKPWYSLSSNHFWHILTFLFGLAEVYFYTRKFLRKLMGDSFCLMAQNRYFCANILYYHKYLFFVNTSKSICPLLILLHFHYKTTITQKLFYQFSGILPYNTWSWRFIFKFTKQNKTNTHFNKYFLFTGLGQPSNNITCLCHYHCAHIANELTLYKFINIII